MGSGASGADPEGVAAHPQGLAQCRHWLATNLPGVKTEAEASNARAAERAREERGVAAIAADAAAETYGLVVLAPGIQDEPGNLTRFVILAAHDTPQPSGDDKTSILFSVRDEVGITDVRVSATGFGDGGVPSPDDGGLAADGSAMPTDGGASVDDGGMTTLDGAATSDDAAIPGSDAAIPGSDAAIGTPKDSGCACDLARGRPQANVGWIFAALLLALLRRRRRASS